MISVNYINYNGMGPFYSVKELYKLFGLTKKQLQAACETYEVIPQKIDGVWGFSGASAKILHYRIYHVSKMGSNTDEKDDLWK